MQSAKKTIKTQQAKIEKLEKKFGLYVGSGSSRFAPVLAPSGATPVCNFIAGRAEEPPAFAVRTENSTSDGSRMTGESPLHRGGLLLGLCDGFGCAGLTMELENLFELCNVKNYIAIEKNKAVRSLAWMDNEAARIFCMESAAKTRLKHIDCRQEFVRLLRNKDILRAVHVPSKENLADLMTKILPRPTFEYLMEKYFIKYKGEKSD